MSTIALIGFRGSGKTTIGRWLAEELDLPCIDTDSRVLEALQFESVTQAWQSVGEQGWRDAELQLIPSLLRQDAVVSLGGGAPMISEIAEALAIVSVVLNLTADEDVISQRLMDSVDRPSLSADDMEIRLKRLSTYARLGTHAIDTSGDLNETKRLILAVLR